MKKIENMITTYYTENVAKFGSNPKGMGWISKKDQYLRFDELTKFFDLSNSKIHDLGCGNGELLNYILKNKIKFKKYCGTDISNKMISLCKEKFKNNKKTQFYDLGKFRNKKKIPKCEFVLASGIFNIKKKIPNKDWEKYFFKTLEFMFSNCTKGISFNVLTFDNTFKNPENFYPKLDNIIKFCRKKLSKKIIINHSYNLWEYTVFIFKK